MQICLRLAKDIPDTNAEYINSLLEQSVEVDPIIGMRHCKDGQLLTDCKDDGEPPALDFVQKQICSVFQKRDRPRQRIHRFSLSLSHL